MRHRSTTSDQIGNDSLSPNRKAEPPRQQLGTVPSASIKICSLLLFAAVVAASVSVLISSQQGGRGDSGAVAANAAATTTVGDSSAGAHSESTARALPTTNTAGSKHATVMGMATGYSLNVYRNFVGSLRKSGFEGNIIIGVSSPMKPGVEEYLKKMRVTPKVLQFVNCTFDPEGKSRAATKLDSHAQEQRTCAHPYPGIKLRWSRFPLLRDWLEECTECTGPVLVADFRDTFFQLDPFGVGAPAVTGLQVFREHKTQTTAHWIVQGPVQKCKGMDFGKEPLVSPMLCSGTTVGTRDAMLAYLDAMYTEMKEWMQDPNCCCNKMNGDDQSIHNYLFYTGKLPGAIAVPNRMGIVNTAGVQGSMVLEGHAAMWKEEGVERPKAMGKPYPGAKGKDLWIGLQFDLTDKEGYFIDFDGGRSRIVHQYDRFGIPFRNYLSKKGKLWELLEGPD